MVVNRQVIRIYNNVNRDGPVTENTHIFKVAENGDVSVSNDLTATGTVDADTITTDGISITDNNIIPSRSNDNIVHYWIQWYWCSTGSGELNSSGSISGTINPGSVTGTVDATISNCIQLRSR